jgi:hypothetical protein
VYRKVKVLFDRDTTLVSINGENVFRFKDELRPRTYDTGTTGYIRWWHNSPVARKIKNLKVSNGEKWAQEYDSAGLSSNISYTHGLVGVGTSVPEYTLDVAGDIRASGNLIINGSNTLINTTSLAIEDGVIECGKGNSSAAKDLGFLMVRNDGSSTTNSNVAMFWDESTDALTFGFSDSGPTATTLTPNTTKTLTSYFAGNVGVGIASPTKLFEISGASGLDNSTPVHFRITNTQSATSGSPFTDITKPAALISYYTPDTSTAGKGDVAGIGFRPESTAGGDTALCFYTDGDNADDNALQERMCITHEGNVGIGVASPTKKLQVYTSASEGNTQLLLQSATRYSSLHIKDSGGGIIAQNDEGTFRLITGYDASDSGGTEKFRVTGSGNVGIGTATVPLKFEVHDSSAGFAVDVSNSGGPIVGNHRATADSLSMISLGSVNICSDANGNSTGKNIDFRTNSFSDGGTLLMRIQDDGNVGIGLANPGNTLDVRGGANVSSDDNNRMKIDGAGTVRRHYVSGGTEYGAGLHFTSDAIFPTDYAGNYVNNQIDLGTSARKWKGVHTEYLAAGGSGQVPVTFTSSSTWQTGINIGNLDRTQ